MFCSFWSLRRLSGIWWYHLSLACEGQVGVGSRSDVMWSAAQFEGTKWVDFSRVVGAP